MSRLNLVGIKEASQIIGVSEVTLRQWTNEGKISAFTTPGGHRRYSKAELRRFIGLQSRVHSIKDVVAELEGASASLHEVARSKFKQTSWFNRLSRESQERLAQYGRRLLNLVIRYITDSGKREETISLVHETGCNFGEELAGQGLSLMDSLEAFVLHRDPVVNSTTNLLKKRETLNEHAVEVIPLVTHIMDEALVSLVAAHQKNREA